MQLTTILLAASAAVANAALTYNITAALAPGKSEKYRCMTVDKWNSLLPSCFAEPIKTASKGDGCAYDDFVCHCVNTQAFTAIIEPLVLPPSLGGVGSCTPADLGAAQAVVLDGCNFFNATLYLDYLGCGIKLSELKTIGIIAHEGIEVTT